jgi:hypothetical protein
MEDGNDSRRDATGRGVHVGLTICDDLDLLGEEGRVDIVLREQRWGRMFRFEVLEDEVGLIDAISREEALRQRFASRVIANCLWENGESFP